MQFEGEKSTLREATPDYSDERNSLKKAFSERPSEALLKEKKRTLREATPGQPRDESLLDDWSHATCLGSDMGLSWPWGPDSEDDGEQHSNKVDGHPDKVTPQTVNREDEEQPNICCSSQICQPTEWLLESQDQQAYGQKHKTEGEEDMSDHPAQYL